MSTTSPSKMPQDMTTDETAETEEDFCTDENECAERYEVLSPSGRYKLVIRRYRTKDGCWNCSRGTVWAVDNLDGPPAADVKRNYDAFPFAWIDKHPDGRTYFVCGADYQGQTVVELETGKRVDYVPPEAKDGFGFCWIGYEFHAPTQMLIVDGCYWACPYETRFYDFRTPMAGWPEIESEEVIDCDARSPEIDPDGITIRCFETVAKNEEDDESKERVVAAIKTFRREGDPPALVLVEEWVSEDEKKRRADREEANRQYKEWERIFRETDPLYLKYVELAADPALSPQDYWSLGVTHEGWGKGSDYTGNERRWCRRIIQRPEETASGWTADLEWAVLTGPVKVILYKDGNHHEDRFFSHSVEGMIAAFAYVKSVCCAAAA